MDQIPLLERHRMTGVVLALAVLVAVGLVTGTLVGRLVVRVVHLLLRAVTGDA